MRDLYPDGDYMRRKVSPAGVKAADEARLAERELLRTVQTLVIDDDGVVVGTAVQGHGGAVLLARQGLPVYVLKPGVIPPMIGAQHNPDDILEGPDDLAPDRVREPPRHLDWRR